MLSDTLDMLGNPVVAAALGVACAVVFLLASRSSFRLITPDHAEAGLALAALSLFMRLAAATAALWAYKSFVPEGIKPFAISFAGGFLVLYTIELVRYAGLHRYRRPVSVRQ